MHVRWVAIVLALPIAACAVADRSAEAGVAPLSEPACDAAAVQRHVGHNVSAEMGAAILKQSGARTLRWGPPRSAMTLDYRQDRLNIFYNDAYKIERITCG